MWGSGDGAAHLPASCPDLRVCPPLSEAASWDVVPDTQQPGRNVRLRAAAREGPQRRDVCRVSSLPFGMLARQSVALTLGLAGTRASSPPSAPGPACSPPLRPRTQCLLSRQGGGGGAGVYSVTWVMGRSRPCLGKGPQHPTARWQASTSPGALGHTGKLLGTGGGGLSNSTHPPHKPLPRLLSHSGKCLRPQQSRRPGVGCFSGSGDPGCS